MRAAVFWRSLVIVSIAALTTVPLASSVVSIPRTSLHGVQESYQLPQWSLAAARSGQFQEKVEEWALRGHPGWGWSVRLLNEIVYSLVGEISLDYRTSVQGGNEGYLWQPMYARAFNRVKPAPRRVIRETFRQLQRVQHSLASQGVPLIAVINPNLIMLYPELLPEKYKAVKPRESSYEVALQAIDELKPSVINAHQLLASKQPLFPFRFFQPTGSHWNDVGSCIAAREVASKLAAAWGEEIPPPQCEKFSMELPPRAPELDLVEIANLLRPSRLYREAPYLTEHPRPSLKKPRKVLLIGTSFLFGLEKQLLAHGIASSTTLLFYFRQTRPNGEGAFRGFDRKRLSREELLSYDAIILDVNAAGPGVLGYGFLPFASSILGVAGSSK